MGNIKLQFILIVLTLISLIITVRITNKSKMEIKDASNWFLVALFLVIASVFPQGIVFISSFIGIELASNAVFSFLIFLLLCIVFYLNIKISKMEMKLKETVQEISLLEKKLRKDT